MSDLDLTREYEPGTPEFLAVVRRDVLPHVLEANEAHDSARQRLLDEHSQYRNLIEMSDEKEHVKHSLLNGHRKNTTHAAHGLRTLRGEAIRAGLSTHP